MAPPDDLRRSMRFAEQVAAAGVARAAIWLCGVLITCSSPAAAETKPSASPAPLRFNRDVRPILSDKCFRCHGPDATARKADLRLDDPASATASREGTAAVVPGRPESSELIHRVATADADLRMPPADSDLTLTDAERETLRRWIAEGAKFEPHWAFTAPVRPPVPRVREQVGVRNPIDAFVRAKLDDERLTPSPEAAPETLCRRLHLDLTGLPPTPQEVDDFVAAYALNENAFDALVDRLLASPRYGERMAAPWLDAARYADTHGYQTDGPRVMWRWRDWVIDAYNRNLPFDQFTIEQLAGDLLPNPTLDQLIATGFNRNHRANAEGGIIPEEFLVEYVADRTETTAAVWLGLTLGCARCHEHKYDPFSQRDYYRLFAFFNQVPELGKVIRDDNSPPFITAPTASQQARLKEFDDRIATTRRRWESIEPRVESAIREWVVGMQRNPAVWTIDDGLLARYRFDGSLADDLDPKMPLASSPPPRFAGGPFGEAVELDGRREITVGKTAPFDSEKPFTSAVWIKPEVDAAAIYSAMDADMSNLGIELRLVGGRVEVIIANRILDDLIRVESKATLPTGEWSHVAWTYDGTKSAEHVKLYVDGRPIETKITADILSNKFKAAADLRIGAGESGDPLRGRIADLRFYGRELSADEIAIVFCDLSLRSLAQQYPNFGHPASALKLREYFLRHDGRSEFGRIRDDWKRAERERAEFVKSLPTTMVMRDQPGLRETHVLIRGEYDKPGERVSTGVPAWMPPLPAAANANRLALARWIVDPKNPLTARVAVNRIWQMHFGVGLVKTGEDFGSQGEWPVHQELLDWLADEFVRSGWDVKRLHKLIVASATYRQSSRTSAALAARDPENRLLARGPRFRLSAEAVRDSALYVAGLLTEKVGGPSVKPYQPPGLWEELASAAIQYDQSHGDDLYRRSLYTYRKRTIGPPGMMVFDAAGRETCVVRSARTNTPLQALNLLNDVTYVEAARALATRMIREGGASPRERVAHGFRLATGRRPTADELKVLIAGLERRLARFRDDAKSAVALNRNGESPVDSQFDPVELAAYATIGNVLLNLDEFVTLE